MAALSAPRWWPAPAKLNLFLHIVGRRADGYHELQTVFQLLDWCDQIELAVLPDGRIERPEGPEGVGPEADLTVRAARGLQAASGTPLGARIRVLKRIPLGGGLGGGSSDAATVLVVLNRLWNLRMSVEALAALGLSLGADVPVFVRGSSAWADGVGERLSPIALRERWFLVIDPGVQVRTADVFQAPELTRNSPVLTIRALLPAQGRNDCEPVVRVRYPAVDAAMRWLEALAVPRLTGTGACVYAAFDSAAQALAAQARVPGGWRCFVARGVNRSPLLAELEA